MPFENINVLAYKYSADTMYERADEVTGIWSVRFTTAFWIANPSDNSFSPLRGVVSWANGMYTYELNTVPCEAVVAVPPDVWK